MNQRLINKIKLFDKIASEALIVKKADEEGSVEKARKILPWMGPAALIPGIGAATIPAAGYAAYEASKASKEEKLDAYIEASRTIKKIIRDKYKTLLSYAPTEAAFRKAKEDGILKGNATTREQYISPNITDEKIEDEVRRDRDIKNLVNAGYLDKDDVERLVEQAKKHRDEILADLRKRTNEEKNPTSKTKTTTPGPKLPQSNLATTPSYQGSGSTVKKTQSDFSERDLAEYQRVEANSQAKQYADGIWNSTKQARESGPQGIQKAKESIQNVINNSSREANNISSPMFNRFKNLRIIQILSTYLKTLG